MDSKFGERLLRGILLIGFLFILLCLIGALNAFDVRDYFGAALFMLAASLPITAALHGVFNKR